MNTDDFSFGMPRFIRVLLLLSLTSIIAHSQEVRIGIGTPTKAALALIEQHSGVRISYGLLALLPAKDGRKPEGNYWYFRDYDAVIALDPTAESVDRLSFWTKVDFDDSLDRRSKSEQLISSLFLNPKTKLVRIEKQKR